MKRWVPGPNDSVHLRHPIHIGEARVTVIEDKELVRLVDGSGTFRRPWVRRLCDLEAPLSECPPWGPASRGAMRETATAQRIVTRVTVLACGFAVLLVGASCRARAETPRGEWDEPCARSVHTLDRVHRSKADEAAAITLARSLVFIRVPGTSAYARRHEGFSHHRSGVFIERYGDACVAERNVEWRRGKECEIEHTTLSISNAACVDLLTCARNATPAEGDGVIDCGPASGFDGDSWSVAVASDHRYRGCNWSAPPACVGDAMHVAWSRANVVRDAADAATDAAPAPAE